MDDPWTFERLSALAAKADRLAKEKRNVAESIAAKGEQVDRETARRYTEESRDFQDMARVLDWVAARCNRLHVLNKPHNKENRYGGGQV